MKKIKLLVSVAVLIFISNPCWGDLLDGKGSLEGIKIIYVNVDTGGEGIINESLIRTDAELKLRMAGIRVIGVDSAKKLSQEELTICGALGITINMMKQESLKNILKSDEHIFSINVYLAQKAMLPRLVKAHNVAVTWLYGGQGISSEKELESSIRNAVKNTVDEFLNDYLAVNPKQAGKP